MVRVTDPERSRAFYEALGMEFRREGVFMGKAYEPDEYRRVETDPERVREIVRRVRGER